MKTVYIAAPLTPDESRGETREGNLERAARWVRWAARAGVAPVATWIVLASGWDESMRDLGLEIDCALVRRCDELWLVGGRMSSGMLQEAKCCPIVRDLTALGPEPPPHYPQIQPDGALWSRNNKP